MPCKAGDIIQTVLKIKQVGIFFDFNGTCSLNHGTIGAVEGSMKVGIGAPERCLLHHSLACCVMPGKSPGAGLAPIDINTSGVRLLGLLGLAGNSNTWLGRMLQRLWTNDANKAQSTILLFIYLFIYLSGY